MSALAVALIYFGTFLAIGLIAKVALGRWMRRHGENLREVQSQAGRNRRKGPLFLLGFWRNED